MKIKPLLKTHWLASQNPMMISLGGVKSVVFCPPPQVVDFEFGIPTDSAIEINLRTQLKEVGPTPEEFRDVMSRSHTLSRDLFWTLFSGHDLVSMKAPVQSLRDLAQSVELHYENGESYSLVSIFRKEGLPFFLNPQFYLQDRSCHWEKILSDISDTLVRPLKVLSHQKKSEDFKRTWIVILEILAWSLQRKRQVGDLEVIWAERQHGQAKRFGYPIQDIEFVKARPLAVTVMAEAEIQKAARVSLWQASQKILEPSLLQMHSVGLLFDEKTSATDLSSDQKFYPEEIQTLKERGLSCNWSLLFSTTFLHGEELQEGLERLKRQIPAENIYLIQHSTISGSQLKPRMRLHEDDGVMKMAVSFALAETGLVHLNFPFSISKIIAPFFGGLDSFFKIDRKDYASKQEKYRQNDLLFLRHQGMTLFCLLELTNWKLGRALTSGTQLEQPAFRDTVEFDRQFLQIIQYFKQSIPGLIGKSNEHFEAMFSSEVKNFFLDFVEKLYGFIDDDQNFLFQSNRILEIKNVHESVLIFIRFLILHFVEETGGKILMKAQSAVGDQFKENLSAWTSPRVVSNELYQNGYPAYEMDIGVFNKYVIHLLFDLIDHGVDIEFNGVPFLSKENPFEFVFSVQASEQKEDTNWFDLHPQIFFNGTRISSEEVKLNFTPDQMGFIEYQGQIYRIDKKQIPTLKALQKFWQRIQGRKHKVERSSFGDKIFHLDKSIALELLMLKSKGIQVNAEGEWQRIFEYFENGLGVEKIKFPERIQACLLPHQRDGAQWLYDLYELKLGAILADEMGLGKTFQVLAFLESLKAKNHLGHSLIVVPTSLVYNWLEERKKFSPDLPFAIFQSTDRERLSRELAQNDSLVLVTTYGLLNENREFFETYQWNVVVFDEAQNLKNIMSVRSISARKLNAKFKVCLTGTPMENNYLEFYSLCDLVVPGCLGEVEEFRKNYYNNEVRTDSLRELRLITKPLLLRRTKTQVKLNLPVKTIQQVVLPFSEQQKEIYKKMAMTFSRQVDDLIQQQGERKAQIAMFAALMRLRQICSDPAAVPGVQFDKRPVKVEHFLNSLQDHLENGESVIVFTQFLSTLSRIEMELKKAKVNSYTLQGRVPAKERLQLIDAFNKAEEPSVMLMTLKTGGVGLNLTKASVVYHLEPWWNPAVENQATDRAHRMGQTKDVKVFNLLIEGSLEERISELKVKKQNSFDRLFSNEEEIEEILADSSNALTREDFLFLLRS